MRSRPKRSPVDKELAGRDGCFSIYRPDNSSPGVAMSLRAVKRIIEARPTLEGAGVKLHRAFGFGQTSDFDPFLLFDDFRNDNPADYAAGFPWHPHRGIETITYVLAGSVSHADSLGNQGSLGAGDVQWMTAGRGILHQEMPKGNDSGKMHGFQLWANLPASMKMTTPRYQDVSVEGYPRSHRRRRDIGPGRLREFLGKDRPRRRNCRGAALP
ncbi:MAG: pirin family protein [Ignavibacteriales bacterium]|nr:pirin family protein [Ignavibacteriales bacterium]